jgi:hypothetical protein
VHPQVGERHDAVMSSLGLPPELVKRLRQKSKEHKQLSGLFKRADWEQVTVLKMCLSLGDNFRLCNKIKLPERAVDTGHSDEHNV